MINTPFTIYESGSYITVTDPTTNEQKVAYIISLPSASATDYYWGGPDLPNITVDGTPRSSLIWSTQLGKFIVAGDANDSASIFLSNDGVNWESATVNNVTDYTVSIGGIACSDVSTLCAAGVYGNETIYDTVAYTNDGYNWSYGTASIGARTIDVCWSPEKSKFVGLGLSGSNNDPVIVTSSNGINWKTFNLNPAYNYKTVAWASASGKFLTVGFPSFSDPIKKSHIYSSADGDVWTKETEVNNDGVWTDIITSGSTVVVAGAGSFNTGHLTQSVLTSTDLTSWTVRANPFREFRQLIYSPSFNKFIGVGRPYEGSTQLKFITSSNLVDWYVGTLPRPDYPYTSADNPQVIAQSSVTNKVVTLGTFQTFYSPDGNDWFTKIQDKHAIVGFSATPSSSILNTPLSPWTSSITTTFGFDTNVVTWVELDMATSANYNEPNYQYIPTSSYGIILDSASLAEFTTIDYGNFVEDVEIDGVRYLREISQSIGEEGATYNFGYYETATTSTIRNTDTSSFVASFKASGRDYVNLYYGASGNNLAENVAMILNIKDGVVEYWEDTSNRYNEGSYLMSSGDSIKFINGPPTLTARANEYWELQFKVGFRDIKTRSGSLTIT